jgi:hypothetical protein
MAYVGNPPRSNWLSDVGSSPFVYGEPAAAPRCAAAATDVAILNTILKRLQARPGDRKLLDLLKRAVESTLGALPTFVEQVCCEPQLKALGDEIQKMPWGSAHEALRKPLIDAIRQAQASAKNDVKHCMKCEEIPKEYDRSDFKPLTRHWVQCPASDNAVVTRDHAVGILSQVIKNAVEWLDKTIDELVTARSKACRGEPRDLRP